MFGKKQSGDSGDSGGNSLVIIGELVGERGDSDDWPPISPRGSRKIYCMAATASSSGFVQRRLDVCTKFNSLRIHKHIDIVHMATAGHA